jgi:hypothetical protein
VGREPDYQHPLCELFLHSADMDLQMALIRLQKIAQAPPDNFANKGSKTFVL